MSIQDGEQLEVGTSSGGQPEIASTPSVQRTSIDVEGLLVALQDPRVADELSRKLQSTKDKRFAAQEKTMSEFQQKLARLEGLMNDSKMTRDQAIRWMEMEDRVNELSNQKAPPAQPATPTAGPQGVDADPNTDAFLQAIGISPNDPGLPTIYENGKLNLTKLADLITRRAVSPTPKPAQAMPTGTGSSPRPETKEEISARILELSRNPSGHWEEIVALRKQLET